MSSEAREEAGREAEPQPAPAARPQRPALLIGLVQLVIGGLIGSLLTWQAAAKSATPPGAAPAAEAPAAAAAAPAEQGMSGFRSVAALYRQVAPAVAGVIRVEPGAPSDSVNGSGFFIDAQGHLVTNHHVVRGVTRFKVRLQDGRTVDARLLGTDPSSDLAVLRADLGGGPPPGVARLGDSDRVEIGEATIVVGNPLGLEGSVTAGILSGRGRLLPGQNGRPIRNVLQTDAAVNPGNSGGPLLNDRGEVIGVVTAMESPFQGNGFGLAVPVNTVKAVLPRLLAGETIQRTWIGISGRPLPKEAVAQFGLPVREGVLVDSVFPGSPAEQAGLRGGDAGTLGDVIVAVDGRPVSSVEDVLAHIDGKKVGDRVILTIIRDGAERKLVVRLGAWPDSLQP